MFKDGLRVVPPVLTVPFEIIVARETQDLPPQQIRIEYDEDGLHFITNWGMCGIRKEDLYEEDSTTLPSM